MLRIHANEGVTMTTDAVFSGSIPSLYDKYLGPLIFDNAAERLPSSRVSWHKVDAQSLPFPDGAFDAVVCQFGVMFFPDKRKAYCEARRVLKPGGHFIFNVWDKLEYNEFADLVTAAATDMFPNDPPLFLARTPHGFHDKEAILGDVRSAG